MKQKSGNLEKLSQTEIKQYLTMIVIDKDDALALRFVKDYDLVQDKDKVTPDEALIKCREELRKIKAAERAQCHQCGSCSNCKPHLNKSTLTRYKGLKS